jgi:peptide/nickel transport system ATP-binding protein
VLNLLGDLKGRGLGILFITHDLSLGNYISDRTLILRHGRVVELGPTPKVFGDPRHSYTRALLACVPQLHRKWGDDSAVEANGRPSATADATGGLVAVDDDHFVAPEEDAP